MVAGDARAATVPVLMSMVGLFVLPMIGAWVCGPSVTQAAPATTRPAKDPSTFSVATYNINYGNANLKLVVETLIKADADLVCLQETNRTSQGYIQRNLRDKYPYTVFRGGTRWADGFAFLSKTPISNVKCLRPKYRYFATWLCSVRLGGKAVRIANVHLRPFDPRGVKDILDAAARMAAAESLRMKEIAYIHSQLSQKMPVIVAGDFNAPPPMGSAAYLAEKGFIDSFAAVNDKKDSAKHATWHWKHKGIEWRYRLDYIFCSRDFRPRASRIIASNASDHYLVVSTFRWPSQKQKAAPTTRPAEGAGPASGGDEQRNHS